MNFGISSGVPNNAFRADNRKNVNGNHVVNFRNEILNWPQNSLDEPIFDDSFVSKFKSENYFKHIELLILEEARSEIYKNTRTDNFSEWKLQHITANDNMKHNYFLEFNLINGIVNNLEKEKDCVYRLNCCNQQNQVVASGFAFLKNESQNHNCVMEVRNIYYASVSQLKEHLCRNFYNFPQEGLDEESFDNFCAESNVQLAALGIWKIVNGGDMSEYQRMYYAVNNMPMYPILDKLCGAVLADEMFEFTAENFVVEDNVSLEPYYVDCVKKCPAVANFVEKLNFSQKAVLIHCLEHLRPSLVIEKRTNQLTSASAPLESSSKFCATLSVVEGPPGCGKTHVICGLIHLFWLSGKNVLITTTSNKAISVLLNKYLVAVDIFVENTSKWPKLAIDGKSSSIVKNINGDVHGLHEESTAPVDHLVFNINKRIEKSLNLIVDLLHKGEQSLSDASDVNNKLMSVLENRINGYYSKYTMKTHKLIKNILIDNRTVYEDKAGKVNTLVSILIDQHYGRKVESEHYYQTARKIQLDYISSADIVFCTLSYTGMQGMKESGLKFHAVIVDEAAQVFEPSLLIPLNNFVIQHVILVGDPKQLPPLLHSEQLQRHRVGVLMERLMSQNDIIYVELNVQYRMHPDIAEIPNRLFYGGRIRNETALESRSCALSRLDEHETLKYHDFLLKRCICVDIEGKQSEVIGSSNFDKGVSYKNGQEAHLVRLFLEYLRDCLHVDIAKHACVITFYSGQVECIKKMLEKSRIIDVEVKTVDSYQGSEKEYVLLSYVRTGDVGFLNDERRLNVAWTRAMHLLISIGSKRCMREAGGFLCEYWDLMDTKKSVYNGSDVTNVLTELVCVCFFSFYKYYLLFAVKKL
jgi:hypothetical protein